MTVPIGGRPVSWLLILIFFHLSLLSLQVRNKEGHLMLRSWGLLAITPIASGLHFFKTTLASGWSRYLFLLKTEDENRRLRNENTHLQMEVSQLKNLAALLPQSEDYQRVKQQYRFKAITVAVIGKGAPSYSHLLIINAGSRQGIRRNTAIVDLKGVVGRVVSVSPSSAEVEPITNHGAGVGAWLEHQGLEGLALGDNQSTMVLDYIPNTVNVRLGDSVVTSGTDRIYPKGLPIGRVVDSQQGSAIYRRIRVQPAVDLARLTTALAIVQPAPDTGVFPP